MTRYQNHEDAFLRMAQYTVEGDLILFDVLYDSASDLVYLVHDSTRDAFSAEQNRVITLEQFDHIEEYNADGHAYWIVYDGDPETIRLDADGWIEGENVHVLASLN